MSDRREQSESLAQEQRQAAAEQAQRQAEATLRHAEQVGSYMQAQWASQALAQAEVDKTSQRHPSGFRRSTVDAVDRLIHKHEGDLASVRRRTNDHLQRFTQEGSQTLVTLAKDRLGYLDWREAQDRAEAEAIFRATVVRAEQGEPEPPTIEQRLETVERRLSALEASLSMLSGQVYGAGR